MISKQDILLFISAAPARKAKVQRGRNSPTQCGPVGLKSQRTTAERFTYVMERGSEKRTGRHLISASY